MDLFLPSHESIEAHQGFPNAGGVCVQDFWAWKETWNLDYIYNVFTGDYFFSITPTVL